MEKLYHLRRGVYPRLRMNPSGYHVRRATVDDLAQLRNHWKSRKFDTLGLEKRFTEFQVVCDEKGGLAGSIGLQILDQQGKIHSAVFPNLEDEESLTPLLWERIQAVAKNHGLFRLWMPEFTSFWRDRGFVEPEPEILKRLPPGFGAKTASWLVLKLKDETIATLSLDDEFTLFAASQKDDAEKVLRQAKTLRRIAYVVVILFFMVVVAGAIYALMHHPARVTR